MHRLCSATAPPPRIHGLDTLRALAVTLVVLHHYVLFVSGAPTFGWVGEIGWVGVDLFFALSGYLIGNQIFSGLRRPGRLVAVAASTRAACCARCRISMWCWRCTRCGRPSAAARPCCRCGAT